MVLPIRDGWADLGPVLDALLPQARAAGAEVLAVGPVEDPALEGVRVVRVDDVGHLPAAPGRPDRGAWRGDRIGEDHAVPRADWCDAVIRAHADHPEAGAIVGCLHNALDLALVRIISVAAGLGGAAGSIRGPGRSPCLVA